MSANYLAAFRGPDLAQIDRAAYSNALLKNQRDRIPQMNKAQDLAIQADQQTLDMRGQAMAANKQAMTQQQVENARGIAANGFAALAQASDPRIAGRQLLGNADFRAAMTAAGIPVDQFTVTDQDDPEQLRQSAMMWARTLGQQVQQQQRPYVQEQGPDGALFQRDPNTNQVTTLLGRRPAPPIPASGPQAPSGYRWKADGTLEPTPGGPADISGPRGRRDSMGLRKEYEDQEPVKTYRSVLPLFDRAANAPDNRAGDISVIYALGKMFDPTSVVREGELQLATDAAPWLQKFAAGINSQMTGQGRLAPAMRADIMAALQGQVDALRAPYEQERGRYSQYAIDSGFDADTVVGPDPRAAFSRDSIPTFETEDEARAAGLAPGTRIKIGNQTGVWQ